MKYWLMKSEPSTYSINDLKHDKRTCWDGVRNYQARNFMRDEMKKGDLVLFYHSNSDPSGVAGIARVAKEGYPDDSAWGEKPDPKASPDNPIWMMVDVAHVETFKHVVSLQDLKKTKSLKDMLVIRRGMRLSVQPVDKTHFDVVANMGRS